MTIKKYFIDSVRENYPYDRQKKKYFSWGFDIWINQRRIKERGYKTREVAEQVANKLKTDAKLGRHGITHADSPLLIELFQKKLDSMTTTPKDRVRAKIIFTRFLRMLPANIKVIDLKQAHMQQYASARLADVNQSSGGSIKPQTVNRELGPIGAALNAGSRFFPELDGYHAPRIPRQKVARGRKERVISRDEQTAILNFLFSPRGDKEFKSHFDSRRRTGQFLQFCLLTLSRPGEVAALKKTSVNLSAGTVTIVGTKTRFTSDQGIRTLKITPTMLEILTDRMAVSKSVYVFTTGGKVTPRMYQRMKEACETNGIAYGREDKTAVSFHTARHTGITRLLQRGVDLKTIGKLAGQSDARMTMYYSHTSVSLMNDASDILENEIL